MDVSRQVALEIFGLRKNFTKEEINKNFRRLSKIVHPDTGGDENLFKFIMCCKEILLDNSKINNIKKEEKEPKQSENRKGSNKKLAHININTLYDIYYDLDSYTNKYDIIDIMGSARIFIIPCKKQKYCDSKTISFSQPFREFEELNFVCFSKVVKLPEDLKKFKKFKIRVEFFGETFEFKVKMNQPYYTLKCKKVRFNSIIELFFE